MGRLFEAIRDGGMNWRRFWLVMDYVRANSKLGDWVLEVGCDDGAFAVGFSLLGRRVDAVDNLRTPFLTSLYNYMPRKFDESFEMDMAATTEGGYSIVHLGEVIEHVKDPEDMVARACRVCSGKIIISAPNFMAGGHLRTYSEAEFLDFVERFIHVDQNYRVLSHKHPDKFQWLAMGEPK
jgi:2-polyprenyl-3-methyl-5-hydroxy-6-metoxy-1,4-benzoquinol methylase